MNKGITFCLTSAMITVISGSLLAKVPDEKELRLSENLGFIASSQSVNSNDTFFIAAQHSRFTQNASSLEHFQDHGLALPDFDTDEPKLTENDAIQKQLTSSLLLEDEVESKLLQTVEAVASKQEQEIALNDSSIQTISSERIHKLNLPFPLQKKNLDESDYKQGHLPLPFPEEKRRISSIQQVSQMPVGPIKTPNLDQHLESLHTQTAQNANQVTPLNSPILSGQKNKASAAKASEELSQDIIDHLKQPKEELSLSQSGNVTEEFYREEEKLAFILETNDKKRVLESETLQERTEQLIAENKSAQFDKNLASDLSENWEREQSPSLINMGTTLVTDDNKQSIDLALDYSQGRHWQAIWETLQHEMQTKADDLALAQTKTTTTALNLDTFNLGDQRKLDFALDLIEQSVFSSAFPDQNTSQATGSKSSKIPPASNHETALPEVRARGVMDPLVETQLAKPLDFALELTEGEALKVLYDELQKNSQEDKSKLVNLQANPEEHPFQSEQASDEVAPKETDEQARQQEALDEIGKALSLSTNQQSSRDPKMLSESLTSTTKDLALLTTDQKKKELKISSSRKATNYRSSNTQKTPFFLVEKTLALLGLEHLIRPNQEKYLHAFGASTRSNHPLINFRELQKPEQALQEAPQKQNSAATLSEQEQKGLVADMQDKSPVSPQDNTSKSLVNGKIRLSIADAEKKALEQNRQILVERRSVDAQEFQYLQQVSKFYPKVTLRSEVRRNKGTTVNGKTDESSQREISGKISLTQDLISTDNYYDIKRGSLKLAQERLLLAEIENTVLLQVRETFYQAILSSEQIRINQDNIERLSQAVTREKQKLELGAAIEFDLEQSKVALTNAFIDYYKSIQDFKSQLNRLANLTGMTGNELQKLELQAEGIPVTEISQLKDKLDALKNRTQSKTEGRFLKDAIFDEEEAMLWEKAALKLRPDVRAVEIEKKEAQTNLQQKKGGYYPNLRAFADYSQGEHTNDWRAGLSLDWNIFDGLGREYRIQEAGESSISKQLKQKMIEERTQMLVRDKIYQIEAAILSYVSSEKSMSLAENAHKLAKIRREAGEISNLEYRDASNALKVAGFQFNIQAFKLLMAYYELRKETGLDVGLLEVGEVDPSIFHEVLSSFKEKVGKIMESPF